MATTNDGKAQRLRLVTYMSPSLPLTLYQTYQAYLEEVLGMESYLMVESRWSGPTPDRTDPFTANDADLGFICSTSYLKMTQEKTEYMELLPVAPIHIHPKSELRPIYFADVIINKSRAKKYKEFLDLKGHVWAFNDTASLSGNVMALATLKRMGFNASFFGHTVYSGSHLNSIQMVANSTVDGASIDSNVLNLQMKEHPELKEQVHVLCSWGPLPIQPVVVNSRLSGETKKQIADALLNMNKSEKWQKSLAAFDVWGFKESDASLYSSETELCTYVKGMSLRPTYY